MGVREYHDLLCLLNTLSIPTKEKAMDIHNLTKKLKEILTITKETTQPIFQQSYHEFCSLIVIDLYSFKVSDHYCYFLDENTLVLKFLKTVCC